MRGTYDENDRTAAHEIALETLLHDPLRRMHIKCSKDIVEQENLSRRVDGTSEGDACFLSTTQCEAFLADFGFVASIKQ